MNTKKTFLKGLRALTTVGVSILVLGSSLMSPISANANVLPVSVSIFITNSICIGQTAHLTWSSVNATSTSIDQGIGSVAPSGDSYVSPAVTTTYVITGTNSSGGYGTAMATVFVSGPCSTPTPTPTPAPTPAPTPLPVTVAISAEPSSICIGQNAYLSWRTNNATQAVISQLGGVNLYFGSQWVSPSQTTTYTITGTNSTGGFATASTTVFVNSCPTPTPFPTPSPTPTPTPTPAPTPAPTPLPVTVAISAEPSSICIGQNAYLSWRTNNATQAVISQLGGVNLYFGSQWVSPSQTTTYTITGTNSTGGFATASTTVFVNGYCYNPTPAPTPNPYSYLSIAKTVRNISSNTNELESVNANSNDTVEFVIRVSSPNNQTATNVRVSDALPYGLNYVSGSTTVDNSYWSDGITSGGINLGTFYAYRYTTIRFRATVNQSYYNNNSTLTNNATASADNASSVSDSAQVITGNTIVSAQSFNVQKFGRDISKGDSANQTSFTARSGDTVEFDIIITAPANTNLYNVIVADPIPNGMTYSPNSTSIDGRLMSDSIATSYGLNVGTITAGQQVTVRLFAVVNASDPSGQVLINTANARADNTLLANSGPVTITVSNGVVLGALNVRTGATATAGLAGFGAILISGGYYLIKKRAFTGFLS